MDHLDNFSFQKSYGGSFFSFFEFNNQRNLYWTSGYVPLIVGSSALEVPSTHHDYEG